MDKKKVSPALAASAVDAPGPVDTVIELAAQEPPSADLPRGERMAAMKKAFEQRASEVEAAVVKAGGEVVEKAWINQTLYARLPSEGLDAVAALDDVGLLDAPRRIKPEG
jgi:hypothetical protein